MQPDTWLARATDGYVGAFMWAIQTLILCAAFEHSFAEITLNIWLLLFCNTSTFINIAMFCNICNLHKRHSSQIHAEFNHQFFIKNFLHKYCNDFIFYAPKFCILKFKSFSNEASSVGVVVIVSQKDRFGTLYSMVFCHFSSTR